MSPNCYLLNGYTGCAMVHLMTSVHSIFTHLNRKCTYSVKYLSTCTLAHRTLTLSFSLLSLFQLFDLKGSMRSRYIDPSKDSSGDVLLDINYLNCKPLNTVQYCACTWVLCWCERYTTHLVLATNELTT